MTAINFTLLRTEHLPFAAHLVQQAGWNQVEADWRIFLELAPAGCFLASYAGEPAGTVTTIAYPEIGEQNDDQPNAGPRAVGSAWISMLLVDAKFRGKGIGTALLQQALRHLRGGPDHPETACVRLDATPAGEPIYLREGFQPEFELHRMVCQATNWKDNGLLTRKKAGLQTLERFLDEDARQIGGYRQGLLSRLSSRLAPVCIGQSRDNPQAACWGRDGRFAFQIGPLYAQNQDTAIEAFSRQANAAILAGATTLIVDVPTGQSAFLNQLQEMGFTFSRRLLRMRLGELRGAPSPLPSLYAIAGPELG